MRRRSGRGVCASGPRRARQRRAEMSVCLVSGCSCAAAQWVRRTYVVTVRGDAIFPSIQLVAGRRFRLRGDGCKPDRAGWRRPDISEHALGQRRR